MSEVITQYYISSVSYANDYERGDIIHRIDRITHILPSIEDLKKYRCHKSEDSGRIYYRLYPRD